MLFVALCIREKQCLPYEGRCPAGAKGWTAPAARTPSAKTFQQKIKML